MGKRSGSGSRMNSPDHISESLETILWVNFLRSGIRNEKKFGSGMEKIRIRKHPGSATLEQGIVFLLQVICRMLQTVQSFTKANGKTGCWKRKKFAAENVVKVSRYTVANNRLS
jgi:hypothetical protein